MGMFDGNGKEGEQLSDFCVVELNDFFLSSASKYESAPMKFLEDALEYINKRIRDPNTFIDILNSGCSCCIALLHNKDLYIANLGYARAVLGTYQNLVSMLSPNAKTTESRDFLREISKLRKNILNEEPIPIQLTCDHTTENQEEFLRIIRNHGYPQKLDKNGKSAGHYYIYKHYSNIPGLFVTRSIGNTIAEDIGVNSIPYFAKHTLQEDDKFLVIASEGI